ncbi:MAG: CRISPR-associated endonuclease Cas2 [Lactimicrobium massiliense]|nr:CRISPR-associated endonuclease Cas2 [Lactimicrobium massiliense]MDD6559979.1 CRISPR-associated endonuclease Cas2 [Lactimicrobium massiliense]
MLLLITYDVNTQTKAGRNRLKKVANICTKYGQRVQKSVFECNVDWQQSILLKDTLKHAIDLSTDSIRCYNLGNNYHTKVDQIGKQTSYDAEGVLMV